MIQVSSMRRVMRPVKRNESIGCMRGIVPLEIIVSGESGVSSFNHEPHEIHERNLLLEKSQSKSKQ